MKRSKLVSLAAGIVLTIPISAAAQPKPEPGPPTPNLLCEAFNNNLDAVDLMSGPNIKLSSCQILPNFGWMAATQRWCVADWYNETPPLNSLNDDTDSGVSPFTLCAQTGITTDGPVDLVCAYSPQIAVAMQNSINPPDGLPASGKTCASVQPGTGFTVAPSPSN
jgi:hypothetical protein